MAEKLASLRKKGGGKKIDPFYTYCRGRYLAQCALPNALLKQYKYIRLYNTAVVPLPTTAEFVTSITVAPNYDGVSTIGIQTLTTTDMLISSLNLTENGETFFSYSNSANGIYLYVIGLHN